MEAKGHEEIIEKVKALLAEKLKELKLLENKDFDSDCLYLGNWIADLSQITDESLKLPIYKFVKFPNEILKIIQKIEEIIHKFDLTKAISNYFKDHDKNNSASVEPNILKASYKLLSYLLPKEINFIVNDLNSALTEFESIKEAIIKTIGTLKNDFIFAQEEYKKIKERAWYDEIIHDEALQGHKISDIKKNPTLLQIENVLILTAKLMGYNKFVIDGKMNGQTFDYVFNSLYKKYLPHEHLDRPISTEVLEFHKRNLTKLYYEIVYPKYIIDREMKNSEKGKIDFYKYLDDYLSIACGRLSEHEKYFKSLNNLNSNKNKTNLEIAKLGNTLHVFEDYFAHTNFIDFAKYFLYETKYNSSIRNEDVKKKVDNLFKYDEDINNNETYKSFLSLNEIPKYNEKTLNVAKNILTGYFGWEDTKVSIFHLLMGKISEISVTDTNKPFFDPKNMKSIVSDITKEEVPNPEKIRRDFIKIGQIGKPESGTPDIPDFVKVEDVKQLFTLSTSHAFLQDKNSLERATTIINTIVLAKYIMIIDEGVQDMKVLNNFVKIIKAIIRIIVLLATYTRSWYRIINLIIPDFVKKNLKYPVKYIIEMIMIYLFEQYVAPSLKMLEPGSHALIAKDDEYRQPKLNKTAKIMAENLDRFIINNLFLNSKNKAQIEIEKAIKEKKGKIIICQIEYDISEFIGNKSIDWEMIYKTLYESDKKNKIEYGLHKIYTDWNFYLKGMISFKEGIPMSRGKQPNYKLINLTTDPYYIKLSPKEKTNYYYNFYRQLTNKPEFRFISKNTFEPFKDTTAEITQKNINANRKWVSELNKDDFINPHTTKQEPLMLNEVTITGSHFDRWFFRIILDDEEYKEEGNNNFYLNFELQKSIEENENDKIIQIKNKFLGTEMTEGMIRKYRDIAIITTYLYKNKRESEISKKFQKTK